MITGRDHVMWFVFATRRFLTRTKVDFAPPSFPIIYTALGHPIMIPAQVHPIRRHPLTTAMVNPNTQPPQPASPPLPRQNAKITPPSPPKVISDKSGKLQFHRVGFLGEGGFARVYEVKDTFNKRFACKVVTKSSLKTKKAKTKVC